MQTCPTCDAPREGAIRYCPACGLDFWRAAAGETGRPADVAQSVDTSSSRTSFAPNFLAIGVIGVIVLGVAGVTSAVLLGALPFGSPGVAGPTAKPLSEEDRLINRFFRQVRDPDAAYVVVAEGEVVISGLPPEIAPPITATAEISLHGDDWIGRESVAEGGEAALDFEVALVDGIGYARSPDAEWVSEDVPERLYAISPFARISTVTEVEYLESEMVDGERRHRVAVTKWLGGREFTDYLHQFAHIDSRESRMEVVVDDLGVPIVADLVMQVVATDSSDVTATFDVTATYRISAWDDVDPIEPPI